MTKPKWLGNEFDVLYLRENHHGLGESGVSQAVELSPPEGFG